MSVWETFTTSDLIDRGILEIGDGYRAKNSEMASVGVSFIRAGDVDGRVNSEGTDQLSMESVTKVGRKRAMPGDVVITTKGTIGRLAFVREGDPDFVYSPQLCYWRSLDNDMIHPRWLFFAMRSEEMLNQISWSAGQTDMAPYVSLTDQRTAFKITLPPLSEQREIAAILGALDDKIELNRKTAATLEAMARALYRSWFVDFDPVWAKTEGRTPAHMDEATAALFPDSFGDDGLPVGWVFIPTDEVVKLIKGRSYKSQELQPSRTALVSLKSFQRKGGYRADGLKPYTGDYRPEQVVSPGEIVISLTDVTQAAELIARATYVRSSSRFETLVASLDVGIIRPIDRDRTPIEFLHQTLNSDGFLNHALAHTSGTTVLHLAKEAIPTYEMLLPSQIVAAAFEKIVGPMRAAVFRAEMENETLTTLRDTLLPKLMSGELRVREAQELVEEVV